MATVAASRPACGRSFLINETPGLPWTCSQLGLPCLHSQPYAPVARVELRTVELCVALEHRSGQKAPALLGCNKIGRAGRDKARGIEKAPCRQALGLDLKERGTNGLKCSCGLACTGWRAEATDVRHHPAVETEWRMELQSERQGLQCIVVDCNFRHCL